MSDIFHVIFRTFIAAAGRVCVLLLSLMPLLPLCAQLTQNGHGTPKQSAEQQHHN